MRQLGSPGLREDYPPCILCTSATTTATTVDSVNLAYKWYMYTYKWYIYVQRNTAAIASFYTVESPCTGDNVVLDTQVGPMELANAGQYQIYINIFLRTEL